MPSRPLEHLHPDRRVRPGVADHARPQRGEPSVVVATRPVLHPDRVSLRVDQQRLLTRERALHRPPGQPRRQRGLGLVRHVLLAAERAAVRDELDGHASRVDAEHRSDLVAVVPYPLASRPHVQPIGPVGQHHRRDERSTRARGTRARCAGSGTPRARRARSPPARHRRRRARRSTGTARCLRDPRPRRPRRARWPRADRRSAAAAGSRRRTSCAAARAISRSSATTIASTSPR